MREKIRKITEVLKKFYHSRQASVNYKDPFKVLISCILSQRTKEENTEIASKNLFKVADTPEKIVKLNIKKLEKLIKPAGFYRQKAKNIKKLSKIIIEKYNGKVPMDREELMKLPGVGYKTSAIVLSYGFWKPIIAVDTHANRISKRLGLTDWDDDVEEVRKKLEKLFPKKDWFYVNLGFVNFGREICRPVRPKCEICPLKEVCKYYETKNKERSS